MALETGDEECTEGLSQRIYDAWTGDSRNGFSSNLSTSQEGMIKAQCYAIASAIVDEITTNGKAVITTSDGGLQQVSDADTDPPTAQKELSIE